MWNPEAWEAGLKDAPRRELLRNSLNHARGAKDAELNRLARSSNADDSAQSLDISRSYFFGGPAALASFASKLGSCECKLLAAGFATPRQDLRLQRSEAHRGSCYLCRRVEVSRSFFKETAHELAFKLLEASIE